MNLNQNNRTLATTLLYGFVIFLLLSTSYLFIFPRTEVEVKTAYHQSFSGNYLQVRLTNAGTHDVSDVSLEITVWKGDLINGELINSTTHEMDILKNRESIKLPEFMYYSEAQLTHTAVITLTFTIDGTVQRSVWSYTIEDYANLFWEDQYLKWG